MIRPLADQDERALADYLAQWEEEIPGYFAQPDWSHARIVRTLDAWARGEELSPGWVPGTTRFYIDEAGRILGNANTRHQLSAELIEYGGHVGYAVAPSARGQGIATRLLSDALELLREFGIARAVLTCAPDNYASARVIEKNGGRLDATYFVARIDRDVSRYTIDLGPS